MSLGTCCRGHMPHIPPVAPPRRRSSINTTPMPPLQDRPREVIDVRGHRAASSVTYLGGGSPADETMSFLLGSTLEISVDYHTAPRQFIEAKKDPRHIHRCSCYYSTLHRHQSRLTGEIEPKKQPISKGRRYWPYLPRSLR
jgi:hypothetical protein